jgi:hypothetical protein
MTYSRLFAMLVLPSVALQAQTPALSHIVTGVVYDSIAHAPLAGAVVQAAFLRPMRGDSDAVATPRTFVAIADTAGRYRLTGLPSGRVAIGFQHDALNALGIDSPILGVELGPDTSVALDLAIPSARVVHARVCDNRSDMAHDGLLAGFVLDARRETTLRGTAVVVEWAELGLDGGKPRSVPHRVATTVGDAGNYVACGVPRDGPVSVKVSEAGYRIIDAELALPDDGVLRRDFRLADSTVVRGTATLTGHVMEDDGRPLPSGLVGIPALGVEVAVLRGEFSMPALPAGTWPVQTRAIGYEPQSSVVDVAERATVTVRIAMNRKPQSLATINVVGKAGRELKVLSDIELRSRVSGGTMFLPGNSYLESALDASDIIRGARGFTMKGPTRVEGRKDCKDVAIYVDGLRYPNSAEGLWTVNNAVPAKQLLAVEAYPDVMFAPYLWRTHGVCAVIAFWTKR